MKRTVPNLKIGQLPAKVLIHSLAGLIMLLGLVVLIGWFTKTVWLIQVIPIFVPMQFNTALCFLLSGAMLISVFWEKWGITRMLSVVVGLIGFLTIIEYAAEISIGLDELFMKHTITVQTSHPGRMAPNTAFCFFLASCAAFLSTGRIKSIQTSGVIGVLISGLGLVSFIGYLIGAEVGYGWGKLTRMAVHTAFGFVLTGGAFTLINWYRERLIKRSLKISTPPWLFGYAGVIALVTFFIDFQLPLGIAAGLSYVLIVLFGWFFSKPRVTLFLAALATILLIVGFAYSSDGLVPIWVVHTNRIFTVVIIWLVAILLYNIKRKEILLERINVALDHRVAEGIAKNKELEQFAYIASHDLQEPLRTVSSFTQYIESEYHDTFDDVGKQSLGYITAATERMRNLIKGLLDYSRIGRKKEYVEIDCDVVLKDIEEDLGSRIKETEAVLKVGTLGRIQGFETEIRLLFQNLISNALKFTGEDVKPFVEIKVHQEHQYWKFSITDNGIGIAKEHQERIFSIFQRLHEKGKYEGTGIGLAHCQKIVQLHQGRIWLESEADVGSTFYFTIPKNRYETKA